MKDSRAFWDASALVPVCVHERIGALVRSHLRHFAPVVWWGTKLEIYSAICSLRRKGQLTDRESEGATTRLRLLIDGCKEITANYQVREDAADLLERYPLRAADALQLAAAMLWCNKRPRGRTLFSADRLLSQAARSAGFSVVAPN